MLGIENFRPNPNGTYGPHGWTLKELLDWKRQEIRESRKITIIYPTLAILFFVITSQIL